MGYRVLQGVASLTTTDRQIRTVTTADGMVLSVEVHGRPDLPPHAPTVVLAHDCGLTRASWDRVLERLRPAGLRIVTWDQRGHGGSSLGVDRAMMADLRVEHLGRDLHAILRALVPPQSPLILVGHSLGGMAVMAYVAEHPEESRARVAGAVLVSTAAIDVRLGQPAPNRLTRVLKPSTPHPGHRRWEVLFGDDPDAEALEAVRAQAATVDPAMMRAAYRAFCQADVRGAFEVLARVPVSILVGAADQVTPPTRSRAMTLTLHDARFVSVPGAGHLLPYEAPGRIVDEVRWVLLAARDRAREKAAARSQAPPTSGPGNQPPQTGTLHPAPREGQRTSDVTPT